MCDSRDSAAFEGEVRRAFARLVAEVLPAAAPRWGWPVCTTAGFERVLLDHVMGAPWENALARPCAATASILDLILAIEVGERILEGSACVWELNRRSLAFRTPCAGASDERPTSQASADPARGECDVSALMRRAIAAQSRSRRGSRAPR